METGDHFKNGASSKSQRSRENILRKPLLLFLFCLFFTVTLFAAKPVTVESGDVSVIKKTSLALLEINFSDTKVGDVTMEEYQKRRGNDFIIEWPDVVRSTHLSFVKFFNNKNKKGLQLTTEAINVSYKLVIDVSYLNMGDSFSNLIPYSSRKAGGTLMDGYIDIIDLKTNKVVLALNVNGMKGKGYLSWQTRLRSVFEYLADNICGLKK
jgi:hypothetical protein